jgi:hypothetical protein
MSLLPTGLPLTLTLAAGTERPVGPVESAPIHRELPIALGELGVARRNATR